MIGLEKMTDNSGSFEQLLREPFFQNDKDLLVCKALYFETVKHKAVFQIRRCDTRSIFFYLARLALGYSIKYKTFEKEANYFFTKF